MRKKSIFNNVLSIFSTNIFIIGVVVISGIILPRLLNPNSLGKLNSLIALAAIVYSFTFLGMRSSLIMHLGKNKYEQQEIITSLGYIFLFSVLLSTLTLIFFFFFLSTDHFSFLIILLVCLINPFEFIIAYMQGYNLAKGKIGRFNRLQWIPKVVYLLAIIILVGIFRGNYKGALIAIILSNLITLLIYIKISHISLPTFINGKIPFKVIKSLLSYGILIALSFMVTRLNHKIDILLLKRMCDLAEVGYYSLGANVAETIWQVPIAVGVVLMAKSATNSNQNLVTRQVCSSLRISLLVVIVAAIVLFIIAPTLVKILFGERYSPSVPIIRTIIPGILFFVILKIINSQFIGTGKPQLTLIALIPALALNIILNLIFIPVSKGIGAAMATNISYFSACFILLLVYSRTFKIGLIEIFSYRKTDFNFIRKIRLKQFSDDPLE